MPRSVRKGIRKLRKAGGLNDPTGQPDEVAIREHVRQVVVDAAIAAHRAWTWNVGIWSVRAVSTIVAFIALLNMWWAGSFPTRVEVREVNSERVVEEHYRKDEPMNTVERPATAADKAGAPRTYYIDEDTYMPAALFTSLLACGTWLVATRRARSFAGALAGLTDHRAAGPLTLALQTSDGELRAMASQRLYQLLPRLKPEDAPLLTAADRSRLYDVVWNNSERDAGLILAILRMVQQTGDQSALNAVEALAGASPRSDGDRRVTEAARQCLRILRPPSREDTASLAQRTLLRPSDSPTDPLLRPAATTEPVPERLLRTAGMESEGG
jgi:hypothetical protein